VFENLNALCAKAPPGSNGLIFLPYLNSAGTPHWNPQARGAFLGIAQDHGRHHFARAVMEGVALEMQDMLKRFQHYGLSIDRIRVGGGAARSALWTQIQANIYNQPVQRLKEGETTALGAAVLAGVGADEFANIREGVEAMVAVADTIEPQPDQTARYAELHAAYEDAYRALAPSTFAKLGALQQ
jgi:xylulokinase